MHLFATQHTRAINECWVGAELNLLATEYIALPIKGNSYNTWAAFKPTTQETFTSERAHYESEVIMKTVHYHKKQPYFYRNKPVIFPAVATLLLALTENSVNAEQHLQSSARSAQADSGKAIRVADNADTNRAGKQGKKSSGKLGSDITTLEPMTVTQKTATTPKIPTTKIMSCPTPPAVPRPIRRLWKRR